MFGMDELNPPGGAEGVLIYTEVKFVHSKSAYIIKRNNAFLALFLHFLYFSQVFVT